MDHKQGWVLVIMNLQNESGINLMGIFRQIFPWSWKIKTENVSPQGWFVALVWSMMSSLGLAYSHLKFLSLIWETWAAAQMSGGSSHKSKSWNSAECFFCIQMDSNYDWRCQVSCHFKCNHKIVNLSSGEEEEPLQNLCLAEKNILIE